MALALTVVIGITVIATAGNDEISINHDAVKITAADSVGVLTDGGVKFRVNFYVDADIVDKLDKMESSRIFAVIADYRAGMDIGVNSGISVDLQRGDFLGTAGDYYYEYTLLVGGITPENVKQPLGIRGFITYTSGGEEYTVASEFRAERDVINPYESVYSAYCNKTYERGTDVNSLRVFLASNLGIKIKNGVAYDELESDKYESLYDIEYFDGVLTVSLKNGDIPAWLISRLSINGNDRYFEIYNGKIKLVV